MYKIIALIALCAFSFTSQATEENTFYGSLGGGVYQLDAEGFDDTAATLKITGGYNFTENVAVEASVTNLFDSKDVVENTHVEIDGRAWDISTRLSYPLSSRITPYARLGWSWVSLDALATEDGEVLRFSHNDDGFVWAVGLGFAVTERLSVDGEYSRTRIDGGDLEFMTLNMNYRFGSK